MCIRKGKSKLNQPAQECDYRAVIDYREPRHSTSSDGAMNFNSHPLLRSFSKKCDAGVESMLMNIVMGQCNARGDDDGFIRGEFSIKTNCTRKTAIPSNISSYGEIYFRPVVSFI